MKSEERLANKRGSVQAKAASSIRPTLTFGRRRIVPIHRDGALLESAGVMWRPPRRLGALLVVVGLEAQSPTPAPTAGCLYGSSDWYGGSAGEDCTTVCGNVGLTCSTSELVARNDEVDSAAEVEALVASIYGETCASNVEATNIAPPYVKTNGDCAYKDPSGNFDCTQDGVGNKRRLCVCCDLLKSFLPLPPRILLNAARKRLIQGLHGRTVHT